MNLVLKHRSRPRQSEGLPNLWQKSIGGTQDKVCSNYTEFIELQNISIKDKGETNDKQDKLGDQSKHFGLVDLPISVCEAVAGQSVSRSKHNDTSDEYGIKDRVRI